MEENRPRWGVRTSNPYGAASLSQVGSTPTLFRQPPGPRALLHHDNRLARLRRPDDRRGRVAFPDALEDGGRGLSLTGDEQTARGLRIGHQQAPPVFEFGRQDDDFAVARPIAVRGAGDEAGAGESLGLSEQRRAADV